MKKTKTKRLRTLTHSQLGSVVGGQSSTVVTATPGTPANAGTAVGPNSFDCSGLT
jgi:hypothetical protein